MKTLLCIPAILLGALSVSGFWKSLHHPHGLRCSFNGLFEDLVVSSRSKLSLTRQLEARGFKVTQPKRRFFYASNRGKPMAVDLLGEPTASYRSRQARTARCSLADEP